MPAIHYTRMLIACLGVVLIVFVAVSLFDLLIAALYARFYSGVAFVVSFGVGGIFGAVLGYFRGMEQAPVKSRAAGLFLIIVLIIAGLVFFFLLSRIEGGEFEAAFRAYGATLALGSLLFIRAKIYGETPPG